MEIQVLTDADTDKFVQLISLLEDVFEMKDFVRPDTAHLAGLLAKEDFFAVVAVVDGQIVGGLTVYVLRQYYSVRPLAYIFDLAVDQTFQRKGVGRSLIEFTKAYCCKRGFEEVFVQADRMDGYALDFYRSTLPSAEEDVVHFYYALPGSPYSQQGHKVLT